MSTTASPATIGTTPSAENPLPGAASVSSMSSLMAEIDRLRREADEKMLLLQREKERLAQEEINRRNQILDQCKRDLGVSTDEDLISLIRNRGIKSVKAKRLPPATVELMRQVLVAGASVPEVRKHFGLSEASVNARKAQWKLTHRKNVKPRPLADILREIQAKAKKQ